MAPWNGLVPLTMVPSLPYLFTSPDHTRKVMAGEIGDQVAALRPAQCGGDRLL